MSEIQPTFRDNRDRLVYLIAEYKVPITVVVLAAGIWAAWASPQIPSPPASVVGFSISWGLLAIPSYLFGLKLAKWLWDPPTYSVGVADPGPEANYIGKSVPHQVWENRTETGYPPMSDHDGYDFVVTRFLWYPDIGELEVRGVHPDMQPGSAWETPERVDEFYEHHHSIVRAYSQLKATVQRKMTEIHDATLMRQMAEEENAKLSADVDIQGMIEDMEEDVDALPDPPVRDHRPQHVDKWGFGEIEAGGDSGVSFDRDLDGSVSIDFADSDMAGEAPAATDGGSEPQ